MVPVVRVAAGSDIYDGNVGSAIAYAHVYDKGCAAVAPVMVVPQYASVPLNNTDIPLLIVGGPSN